EVIRDQLLRAITQLDKRVRELEEEKRKVEEERARLVHLTSQYEEMIKRRQQLEDEVRKKFEEEVKNLGRELAECRAEKEELAQRLIRKAEKRDDKDI
ncbi:MAG: hypothetical protein QXS16_05500, partial [Pyrobaculum sp.]